MWVHLTTESTKAGADDGTKVSTESTGAKADVVKKIGITWSRSNYAQNIIECGDEFKNY